MKNYNGSSKVGPSLVNTPARTGPGRPKSPAVDPQFSTLSNLRRATKKCESHQPRVGYQHAGN